MNNRQAPFQGQLELSLGIIFLSTDARGVYENGILKPSRAQAADAVRPVSCLFVS
jgi:hypothetical protein